ncbi:NADPH-dependent F420 reductase [Jeotgalibacillus aurantiacus]|uniref:NADPH-dependent F420 reductase n=1 Tax=Jeotgalibacillus aurantiacus TaxID=2763266 RepID=UPI001D0B6D32|nr:NADPH-dependent F420 reductase [Jeotgalibacillus aurantiacus]
MKIGILGKGNVGKSLSERFQAAGHEVVFGSRNPEEGDLSQQDAVDVSEVIVLAVPFQAALGLMEKLERLEGKIVVDVTNPIKPDFSGVDHADGLSGAERLQQKQPKAHVVKAFNQTGAENLRNPDGSMMFVAGNHTESLEVIHQLSEDAGFDTHTLHGLSLAKELESLAWLWIHYAVKERKKRDFVFQFKRL